MLRLIEEMQQDLRLAVRLMRRTPAFTATALATLALCLGANLTIFAVVDSVLLRSLPFPDDQRLVRLFNTYPKAGVLDDGSSVTNYYERRGQLAAFTSVAAYREGTAIIGETGSTDREPIMRVSPDFFDTVGLGPVIGRPFIEAETSYQTDNVVVLTNAYWQQRFQSNPHVIGQTIRVDGVTTTIVGVLPTEFRFLSSNARLYFPLASGSDERAADRRHSGSSTHMIARLAPDVTIAEAQSQIDAHNAALEAGNPMGTIIANAGFRSVVVPLRPEHVAGIRPTLLIIQGGALSVLLIGVVNLLNLLLIRASGRAKELAVRQAIGASRRRVVSEVMVETTLIALAGAFLGLLVGAVGIRLLTALGAEQLPMGAQIVFDARLAAAALAGAIVMSIAIGLPVAWFNLRSFHGGSTSLLQSESRSATASRGARRVRHAFLVAQMAAAFVLLSGAGLLALSLKQVMAVAPGFRSEDILTGHVSLPANGYPDGTALTAFTERLIKELTAQPGIRFAAVTTNLPLSGNSIKSAITVKGHRLQPGESLRGHYAYSVSGNYFGALGIPLVEGRVLDDRDSHRAERACVVDEDFARRYWPAGGGIGQRLFLGATEGRDADAFVVVGVVGAVKQDSLADQASQGAVYFPFGHRLDRQVFAVVRSSVPPDSMGHSLLTIVRSLDPELPVTAIRSMETRIDDSLVARRSPAILAAVFSCIALLLTGIGTYGVLSYAVSQRRREIGLRMALGARPEQIRREFLFLACRLFAGGTLLGTIGAWLAGRTMQTLLFHVSAFDMRALAGTAVLLLLVCVAACLLPSNRAARISPQESLTGWS